MAKTKNKYQVIKDTREQTGWTFNKSEYCLGMEVDTLKTGDYTLKDYEKVLCIERKGSTGEFAKNITEDRFFRELERMTSFETAFIVCEFTMDDIMNFPFNSGIPQSKWKYLKVSSNFLLKRIVTIQSNFEIPIVFAGNHAATFAERIFLEVANG